MAKTPKVVVVIKMDKEARGVAKAIKDFKDIWDRGLTSDIDNKIIDRSIRTIEKAFTIKTGK